MFRCCFFFFFSSRRRHTRSKRDWSSDVCSSDLERRRGTSSPDSCCRASPRSRSEEHTSELQSRFDLVCRLLLEKKNKKRHYLIVTKKKKNNYKPKTNTNS